MDKRQTDDWTDGQSDYYRAPASSSVETKSLIDRIYRQSES